MEIVRFGAVKRVAQDHSCNDLGGIFEDLLLLRHSGTAIGVVAP